MINNPLMQTKVDVHVNVDVRPAVRMLLGANMTRIKYDTRLHEERKRFDFLRVNVTAGRGAFHSTCAAELILDGLPMVDPIGNEWVARGMFMNIGKAQNMKLFKDKLFELEGDWVQRDPEVHPLILEGSPTKDDGCIFRGRKYPEVDFIVLDFTYASTIQGDKDMRKFADMIQYQITRGAFPNLCSILIMQ
ncbi:hypothetical protein MYOV003v1_p0088 [Vibrio phage 207E48.1]|nr:hypothetical protein MYOV003v1_p0088 [Vibrio phage 207E48.1]